MFFSLEQHDPRHPALLESGGNQVTYGELAQQARIIEESLPEGALVFCLTRNTIGFIAGYLGMLTKRAVPLLLEEALNQDLLNRLISLYHPGFLWVPRKTADKFPNFSLVATLRGYALLATGFSDTPPLAPELALLLTTSGSTGSPKLVRQSARNIISNAKAIAEYLELTPTERPALVLPLHYTFGLSVLHSHLLVGATVLLAQHSVIQQEFWDFFYLKQATSISGVPVTYSLLERAGFFERNMPGLRSFTQAGGKLSPAMHLRCAQFAKEHGLRFYAMYGQTEATARMSYLPYEKAEEKCGSIGIPIPGGAFSLLDENGAVITLPNREGELVYSGENVTLGYAEAPGDLMRGDDFSGTLHTGDLAMRDEEGYYKITGRKKRFVKLFGVRVSLDECEALLRDSFSNLDCACVGIDDHISVFFSQQSVSSEEITSYLAGTLHFPPRAFSARFLPEIPRTSAGKIQYPQLEGGL